MEPVVGQVVTIFRSRLRPEALADYHPHAEHISDLAMTMLGYVEHKTFTADDGERVTVVTFEDQMSHDSWRDNLEHRAAQRKGIDDYYQDYSIQVATVVRTSAMKR